MAVSGAEGIITFDPQMPVLGSVITPAEFGATIGDIAFAVSPMAPLIPTIPGPGQGYG